MAMSQTRNLADRVMRWLGHGLPVFALAVNPVHAGLVTYQVTDFSWFDSGSTSVSPTSGVGPAISVGVATTGTAEDVFNTEIGAPIIVLGDGNGAPGTPPNPTISFDFSVEIASLAIRVNDLDAQIEQITTLQPHPIAVTGDLFIFGSTVQSSHPTDGRGALIYSSISIGMPVGFTFDQIESFLGVNHLHFTTRVASVPEPSPASLIGFALLGASTRHGREERK